MEVAYGLQMTQQLQQPSQSSLPQHKVNVGHIPIFHLSYGLTLSSGESWIRADGWNSTSLGYCYWFGIHCAGSVITEISLRDNNLQGSIPASFKTLTELITLRLKGNKLTSIEGIPPMLQTLDLSVNEFTTLPASLTLIAPTLINLNVSYNRLTSLPDAFKAFTQMIILDLSNNQLTSVPSFQSHALFCKIGVNGANCVYDVHNNRLTSLDPNLWVYWPWVGRMDVSQNQLTSFPHLNVESATTTVLNGSHNLLKNFPDISPWSVAYLDLSYNSITGQIPPLAAESALTILNLNNNAFTSVSQNFTCEAHFFLQVCNFKGNPLPCPLAAACCKASCP